VTLDSSALLAVLFSEPGYLALVDRMLEAEVLRVGAPTLVEASLVFEARRGRPPSRKPMESSSSGEMHELVKELGVTIVPFGEAEWHHAVDAFVRYGRGRHKAGLNFGGCLAYATAAAASDSLLYVGDDFKLTDLPEV
jgi:ribonuclease VapC